jgi:two-component system cell cycle sensor histidine kinase/response regulator CckA
MGIMSTIVIEETDNQTQKEGSDGLRPLISVSSMSRTLRVLCIEDSERDVELLQRHLSRAGYDLISDRVETPDAMKDALTTKEWDVILCDYSMPHFSALAALALLKEVGLDIPFIIISGTIGEEVAVGAMRAGAQDYLMKDNLVRLAAAIERQMHESENHRAQKRAEEALKASEAELWALFEAMTDVILVLDAEGRHLKMAPTRPAQMYKPADERVGKTLHEVLPKEKADFFLEHVRRALDEGPMHRVEYSLPIGGKEVWFEGSVSPMTKDSVIWIGRDITERKILEEQLRQSQKMEAIGQLAGGIAHDFNNLLTAITGYSDLTLRRLQAEDPLRSNIEEVKKAGERAASLTRQLLAFSRKQVLQPKVFDLNSVISELEKMLQRLIGEDIELRTVLGVEPGSVKADPGQIEQVIMNLVVNARDAMPYGGKLTIETKNIYLGEEYAHHRSAVDPGSYVMLAISDTGIGMDEKTQARIFEPFFTSKEAGKGTGLGLSTVYGIVKQSDGNIWVYSEVGRGTTFKVYLPRVDESVQEYKRGTEVEEDLQGTESILLAEDEDTVRRLARDVLEMYGYRVLEAPNGGAAFLICERHKEPIHLLVTDVIMPEMSGPELTDRLIRLRPEMKVLYMSGYTDNAIVHRGVLDEGTNFIQKPFTPNALARRVREVLDRQ